MKSRIFFISIFLCFINTVHAQNNTATELLNFKKQEDSLKDPALQIIRGINAADRFKADSLFTRMLVRTLSAKNSFNYSFDSLETISQLYAPDSSFKIFTWHMFINDNIIRQHGAIQMKTKDGSLKLFPLVDRSDITINMEDTISNHLGWIGAIYYRIILKTYNNQPYYTLLGFDENNIRSNKKIIEVLHFKDGEPRFGGPFFMIPDNQLKPGNHARYIMEYKKAAGPRLTYDESMGKIILEHLISESNEPGKKWTLIGDGDYEAFQWQDGKWVYINKVFNEVTPEGQTPMPIPLRDDEGTIDPTKLKKQ